jgi:hypothetical protein
MALREREALFRLNESLKNALKKPMTSFSSEEIKAEEEVKTAEGAVTVPPQQSLLMAQIGTEGEE